MTAPLPSLLLLTDGLCALGRALLRALADDPAAPRPIALCPDPARVPESLRALATWRPADERGAALPLDLPPGAAIVHLLPALDPDARDLAAHAHVSATARLIDAARARAAAHLLFVCGAALYAPADDPRALLDEDAPLVTPPCDAAALIARQADALARWARAALPAVATLRHGDLYGPAAEEDDFLPRLAEAIAAGEQIMWTRPDGDLRAPTWSADLVAVVRWALATRCTRTLNVTGPEALTEAALARALAAHLHEPLAFVDVNRPARSRALCAARLDALFPERPRTPWADGLTRAWPD